MKAIRVHETGGPEVMRLEELPDPEPGPGELVLRVHAAGVNPVETYRRAGIFGPPPPLPWTPGSDAAGVVERLGEGVSGVSPGDRVYTDHRATGAYAERMLCRAEAVHPLPPAVPWAAGAALGIPYTTAYRALFHRGAARPGETLLVHGGTGGVGLAAIQLARAAGLTVLATGGTEQGREEALRQGAHQVLDHHREGYLEEIVGIPDLILELLANENLGRDLPVLAKRGRVVVVGARGPVKINPREAMALDADVRAMQVGNTPAGEVASIHAALRAGLENGTLAPVIAEEIPLAQAARAHERVMAGGRQGKIVLTTGA